MMKHCTAILLAVSLLLFLPGCKNEDGGVSGTEAPTNTGGSSTAAAVDESQFTFSAKDEYTEYTGAVEILLDGAAASGSGWQLSAGSLTIGAAGTYVLSGTLNAGQIIVDADSSSDVRLVLNHVSVVSPTSAALYVKQADKVIVSLAEGTENSFSDTASFTEEDEAIEAAIFSKDDLTINGPGSLCVYGNVNDGIQTKDTLKITGGNLTVKAVDDGVIGKDGVLIQNGSLTVYCGDDGIKGTGTEENTGYFYMENGSLKLVCGGDGIQAETSIFIKDGNLDLTCGGSSGNTIAAGTTSFKGLKSGGDMQITGGSFSLNTADDSIHSNAGIQISGGDFAIDSGDDGIHADNSLTVSGGNIQISQSYEGLEALNVLISGGNIGVTASDDGINAAGGNDGSSVNGRPGQNNFGFGGNSSGGSIEITGGDITVNASGDGLDSNGTLTISGGTLIINGPTSDGDSAFDSDGALLINGGTVLALGSSGMLEQPDISSEQSFIVSAGSGFSAGSIITVQDAQGNELFRYTAAKRFSAVIYSSPEMTAEQTYSIFVDGELLSAYTGMGGMGGMNPGGGNNRPGDGMGGYPGF